MWYTMGMKNIQVLMVLRLTSVKLWIVLNLADLALTIVAVKMGLTEINPLFALMTTQIAALVIVKILLTVAAIGFLALIKRLYLLKWLNIGMAIVVAWNLLWLLLTVK